MINFEEETMNAFIYDENGNLSIRKTNGLRWTINQCDKPNLGFEYDIIVYDNEEFKIEKLDPSKDFRSQQVPLTELDKDAIENFILSTHPPRGFNLNNQYLDDLRDHCDELFHGLINDQGFDNIMSLVLASRQGSNHPKRKMAREVLEFYDAVETQFEITKEEILLTREDNLRDISYYRSNFPMPNIYY